MTKATASSSAQAVAQPNDYVDKFLVRFDSHPLGQKVRLFWKEHSVQLKPASDFFDTKRMSRPVSFQAATTRFNHNIMYFKANYGLVVLGLLLYCLITNLWLLFALGAVVTGVFYAGKMPPDSSVVLAGKSFSQKQLYALIGVSSVPLLWISGAGQTLFWVIGVSVLVVLGHAVCTDKSVEAEFAEQRSPV